MIISYRIKSIYIPKSIADRTLQYLTETHPIFKWFLENYEKCPIQENPKEWITMGKLSDALKQSDYFAKLSKRQQKDTTRPYLCSIFKDNNLFKDSYVQEINTHYLCKKYTEQEAY